MSFDVTCDLHTVPHTPSAHKKSVEEAEERSYSAGAQAQMSVLKSVSDRLVTDMRQVT